MKKIVFALLLGLSLLNNVQAQRYLAGQKGIQLTVGAVDGFTLAKKDKQAFAGDIAISNYTKNGNRWVFGVGYLQKSFEYNEELIPVSQFTGEIGHYVNFLSDRSKTFFFSVGFSAMAGYETVNWGDEELSDGAKLVSGDNFLYGGALGLELETFLTDRIALLFHAKERLSIGSDINKFHFQYGLGVKFIIN